MTYCSKMCGRQGMTRHERDRGGGEVRHIYTYKYIIIIMEYVAWKCDNMWFFLRSPLPFLLISARTPVQIVLFAFCCKTFFNISNNESYCFRYTILLHEHIFLTRITRTLLYVIYVFDMCACVTWLHTDWERASEQYDLFNILLVLFFSLACVCTTISHLPLCQDPRRSFQLELVHYR